MKRFYVVLVAMVCLGLAFTRSATAKSGEETGDTRFAAYEGEQRWPRSDRADVINDYAVPIYIGLPTKHYKVLGRIYVNAKGLEVVGRAFDEGLGSEKRRMRHCANQAKARGGDAVLVTSDPKVLDVFKLTRRELRETTPLFEHKDKVTLVIKFE